MKLNLSGSLFFLFVTYAYTRSEDYIGFFNNCYTITKKKNNMDQYSCITMGKKNIKESSIMATVSLVILLQNFKEQKRERQRDRNKGKQREFS